MKLPPQNQSGQLDMPHSWPSDGLYPAESLIGEKKFDLHSALPQQVESAPGVDKPQFGKPDSVADSEITSHNGPPSMLRAFPPCWPACWMRVGHSEEKHFYDLPCMEARIYWALTQIRFRDIDWIIRIVTQSKPSKSPSKCLAAWNINSSQYR